MSDFPKWPLVYVEWEDSCGSCHWTTLDDNLKPEPSVCRSVGWMASKTKRCITLYSDLATNRDNKWPSGHSEQVIPMGCVKKIKRLADPTRSRR